MTLKSSWPRRPNPLASPLVSSASSSAPSTVGPDQVSPARLTRLSWMSSQEVMRRLANPGRISSRPCTKRCSRGKHRSPLWLLYRLVLIPKPSDNSSAPITLRPLGLPEIFYRLAGRAAVRIEGSLVGPTMKALQLGVGIPFGCQIGAKGAQCAFDARKALLAVDLNNAFNTEIRQSTFQDVSASICGATDARRH